MNLKKLFAILLFNVSVYATHAQTQLSDEARISVITCGPTQEELYSAFGHSAFRVYDPVNGIDEAYNYGVFDFDQPNFYLNFAKGYLYYKLGVYDYKRFEYYYIYHNRTVHEQVLNLTSAQKARLYDYLLWNAQPENQHYRYDYFYDNCATKMRDVLVKVFADSIQFDGSYIKTDYTIRELTDIYLQYQPWGDLGIDICLGLPMDKKASPYEYMFLPDYIESALAHTTIKQGNTAVPIVTATNKIFEAQPVTLSHSIFHPLIIFSLFLIFASWLTYRDIKRKKLTIIFDVLFFTVLGLIGLLLLSLWTATDHNAAAKNFNLLWALPTHLVACIAFIWQPKWLKTYFIIVFGLTCAVLIFWPLLPQALNIYLIPLVLAIAVRSYAQYRVRTSVMINKAEA